MPLKKYVEEGEEAVDGLNEMLKKIAESANALILEIRKGVKE